MLAFRELLEAHVAKTWVDRALERAAMELGFEDGQVPPQRENDVVEYVMTRVRGFVDDDELATMMLEVAEFVERREHMAPPTRLEATPPSGATPSVVTPAHSGAFDIPPPSSSPGDGETLRVLIVDDESVSLRTMSATVRLLGHRPQLARSADEAKACLESTQFDAMIIDCYMPQTSGFELARWVRASPHRDLPIVAVSGQLDDGTRELAERAGADAVLAKPMRRAALDAAFAQSRRKRAR